MIFSENPSALPVWIVWYVMIWYDIIWYGVIWYGMKWSHRAVQASDVASSRCIVSPLYRTSSCL